MSIFTDVPPRLRRRYLKPPFMVPYGSVAFGVVGRVYIAPFDVPWKVIVDRIMYVVGAVAAGNVRLGIYEEGPTIDLPDAGNLLAESGSVAQPGTVRYHSLPIPETLLRPGRHHISIQGDDTTGEFYRVVRSTPTARFYDHAYGPFTDPCPVTAGLINTPLIMLRVSRNLS